MHISNTISICVPDSSLTRAPQWGQGLRFLRNPQSAADLAIIRLAFEAYADAAALWKSDPPSLPSNKITLAHCLSDASCKHQGVKQAEQLLAQLAL